MKTCKHKVLSPKPLVFVVAERVKSGGQIAIGVLQSRNYLYANSTPEGAIAEFQFHNPGVDPVVFKVEYPVSSTLHIDPPSGYFNAPLPFTEGANVLTAPSLRAPGTINLLIRDGAVPAGIIP